VALFGEKLLLLWGSVLDGAVIATRQRRKRRPHERTRELGVYS
jgi:hypothetical protein